MQNRETATDSPYSLSEGSLVFTLCLLITISPHFVMYSVHLLLPLPPVFSSNYTSCIKLDVQSTVYRSNITANVSHFPVRGT